MKRFSVAALLPAVLLFILSCAENPVLKASVSTPISEGIIWKSITTMNENEKPVFINILDVDLTLRGEDVDIAWYEQELKILSDIAGEFSAEAGVNGSFFNMRQGGSDVFLQIDGQVKAQTNSRPTFLKIAYNGAFAIDTCGVISILSRPESGWRHSPAYEDILAAGPVLILDNNVLPQDSLSFNGTKHPRTAVGITNKNHLLLVTVDGRTSGASGMAMWDLRDLMKDLGCSDAINLDGGGSTSMYISGQNENGIVNCPSDNRKFDHEGQRRVSNAIIIR